MISVELIRPATVNDGIVRIGDKEENEYLEIYKNSLENLEVLKFVPASGAATRMFKDLLSEHTEYVGKQTPDLKSYEATRKLVENLPTIILEVLIRDRNCIVMSEYW